MGDNGARTGLIVGGALLGAATGGLGLFGMGAVGAAEAAGTAVTAGMVMQGIGSGLAIGSSIGSLAAGLVPPENTHRRSPLRYSDLQYNPVQRGTCFPLAFGNSVRTWGPLLWIGNREIKVEDQEEGGSGGTSGGDTVEQIKFRADFAVCVSSQQIAKVRRVFIDDMDISDQKDIAWYEKLGTSTQTAHEKILLDLGNEAPNFRNIAHVILSGTLGMQARVPTTSSDVKGIVVRDEASAQDWTCHFTDTDVTSFRAFQPAGNYLWASADVPGDYPKVYKFQINDASCWSAWSAADVNCTFYEAGLCGRVTDLEWFQDEKVLYATVWNCEADPNEAKVYYHNATTDTWTESYEIPFTGQSSPSNKHRMPNAMLAVDERLYVTTFHRGLYRYSHGTWTNIGLYAPNDNDREYGSMLLWDDQLVITDRHDDTFRFVVPTYSYVEDNYEHLAWARLEGCAGEEAGMSVLNTVRRGRAAYVPTRNGVYRIWKKQNVGDFNTQLNARDFNQTKVFNNVNARFACLYDGDVWIGTQDTGGTGSVYELDHLDRYENNEKIEDESWTCSATFQDPVRWMGQIGTRLVVGTTSSIYSYVDPIAGTNQGNPADVVNFLLTDDLDGAGVPTARVGTTSLTAWRDWCDELIRDDHGNLVHRFEVSAFLADQEDAWERVTNFALACRCWVCYNGRTIEFIKQDDVDSVAPSLDEDDVPHDSITFYKIPRTDRPNRITVQFLNVEDEHSQDSVTVDNQADQNRRADLGERVVVERTFPFFMIPTPSHAQRIAQYYLDYYEQVEWMAQFPVSDEHIDIQPGDVVNLEHQDGWWTGDKQWRVLQVRELSDQEESDMGGTSGYSMLTCIEHTPAVFHDRHAPYQAPMRRSIKRLDPPSPVIRFDAYEDPLTPDTIHIAYSLPTRPDLFARARIDVNMDAAGSNSQFATNRLSATVMDLSSAYLRLRHYQTGAATPGQFGAPSGKVRFYGAQYGWGVQLVGPNETISCDAVYGGYVDFDNTGWSSATCDSCYFQVYDSDAYDDTVDGGRYPSSGTVSVPDQGEYYIRPYHSILTTTSTTVPYFGMSGAIPNNELCRIGQEQLIMGVDDSTHDKFTSCIREQTYTVGTYHGEPPPDILVYTREAGGAFTAVDWNCPFTTQNVFAETGDEIYVGATEKFAGIHIQLSNPSSNNLGIRVEHSTLITGTNPAETSWLGFRDGQWSDGTNGFTQSGTLVFEPPGGHYDDKQIVLDADGNSREVGASMRTALHWSCSMYIDDDDTSDPPAPVEIGDGTKRYWIRLVRGRPSTFTGDTVTLLTASPDGHDLIIPMANNHKFVDWDAWKLDSPALGSGERAVQLLNASELLTADDSFGFRAVSIGLNSRLATLAEAPIDVVDWKMEAFRPPRIACLQIYKGNQKAYLGGDTDKYALLPYGQGRDTTIRVRTTASVGSPNGVKLSSALTFSWRAVLKYAGFGNARYGGQVSGDQISHGYGDWNTTSNPSGYTFSIKPDVVALRPNLYGQCPEYYVVSGAADDDEAVERFTAYLEDSLGINVLNRAWLDTVYNITQTIAPASDLFLYHEVRLYNAAGDTQIWPDPSGNTEEGNLHSLVSMISITADYGVLFVLDPYRGVSTDVAIAGYQDSGNRTQTFTPNIAQSVFTTLGGSFQIRVRQIRQMSLSSGRVTVNNPYDAGNTEGETYFLYGPWETLSVST